MEALTRTRPSPEALALALSIPFLCLHERYSPDVTVDVGTTSVSISTADVAVLVILLAAFRSGHRLGLGPWRNGGVTLAASLLLLATVVVALLLGPVLTDGYPFATKLVSAAKFVEYGFLVLAVPLIVRRRDDVAAVAAAIVAVAGAAAAVGVLQLLGIVGNLDNTPGGRRMPSFLGYHDFAALAGVTLSMAMAIIATGWWRRAHPLGTAAAAAGCIGVIIAGALATVAALLLGGILAYAFMAVRRTQTPRRAVGLGAILLIVVTGSFMLRSGDLADFVGFLGTNGNGTGRVETYSQRTVLSYIGLRIFLDHPLTGVGWQGSELPQNFDPYLADARRRFSDVAAEAFPSDKHRLGVQNAYIQAAADLGLVGLLAALLAVGSGFWRCASTAFRGRTDGPLALAASLAIIVVAAEWAALGLVPGVPATALLWLTLGAAVALPGVGVVAEADDRPSTSEGETDGTRVLDS